MNHSKLIAAKRIAVAVAAVCATMSAPAFAADNVKNLLDLMLKKGVITQAEYDDYLKSDAYENEQFKQKRTDDDLGKASKYVQKHEKDGSVAENGFGLTSANGDHSINLTGRVHFDYRNIDSAIAQSTDRDTASLGSGFEVRRARIGFNGKVFKDINYELVANAVGSSTNFIDTAWINYGFNKDAQIRVGRFKQPFSLEELTSSNSIDFMERSYLNQLIPGKRLGAMIHGEPVKGFTYGASLYQSDFSQYSSDSSNGTEAAGRLTFNFADFAGAKDAVYHVGLAGTGGGYQVSATSSGDTTAAPSATTRAVILAMRSENRGMSNIFRGRIGSQVLNTAAYGGVSNENAKVDKKMMALEAAFAYGPYKLQGEYGQANFDASTSLATAKGDVKANYVELMYNLTGESWAEAYKGGAFSSIKPKSNFTANGGTGAVQLGLRYSTYDASDLTLAGTSTSRQNSDKGNTTTLGVNWLLNPNARVMLNLAYTKFNTAVSPTDTSGLGSADSEKVISLRTQVNF